MIWMTAAILAATLLSSTGDEPYGTAEEAQALVAKAVAYVKSAGTTKAYQDFTSKAPGFADRDLYVVVYDLEGHVLAHGQNPQLVGQNLLELRGPDGNPWVKERVRLARMSNRFWQDYKFRDPITKKILTKSTYCEALESTAVCVGIYKRSR
jgi:cytochrome c